MRFVFLFWFVFWVVLLTALGLVLGWMTQGTVFDPFRTPILIALCLLFYFSARARS